MRLWTLNPDWAWYKIFTKKWKDGHCMTDVHWSDGSTTWLEAQYAGSAAITNLDSDGDGKVKYFDHTIGGDTTEGDKMICVFDNRAQAESEYGNAFPGN